ncbi:MAG: hypothetical protein JEZ03_06400 [Bacteroidales bacterium]|nr:hypothetical protein [Bacteroidales bacterium]
MAVNPKYNGASMVETVIAFTLLSVIMTLAALIIMNVLMSNNRWEKLQIHRQMENQMNLILTDSIHQNLMETDTYMIQSEHSDYGGYKGVRLIDIKTVDIKGKLLQSKRRLIRNSRTGVSIK